MEGAKSKDTASLPLHRVAILQPFVKLLMQIGAPVERGFGQACLPWCALENANNYVPSHNFYKFIIHMAHSEGIPDLGFRAGEKFGAECVDPQMTERLSRALTLFEGLDKANQLFNQTITHSHFKLQQPPNSDYVYYYHRPSCNADNPAIQLVSWFGIMGLIGMVRVYTGPKWQPAEIGLMMDQMPSAYICERFPNTRVRLSQPASYISLEHNVLTLPPLPAEEAIAASPLSDYETLPENFVNSLETILLSYVQESDLSIELAAEICEMSKRSLQRKLKGMGTNYSELLRHARFRAASQMLQNIDITATDVAYQLGYSKESHFARAFRRLAGVSPNVYRQQFIH